MPDTNQRQYQCTWDQSEGILRIRCWGDHGMTDAKALATDLDVYIKKSPQSVLVLDDLRECGTASREAMLLYAELLESPAILRHALLVPVTGSARVTADLLIKMSGAENAQLFVEESAALRFLRGA